MSLAPSAHLSAIDKGDNEMKSGGVYRSSGIYLTAAENPGKPQLGDRLKLGTFPQNEVSRIAQHIRKGDGKDEINYNQFVGRSWH